MKLAEIMNMELSKCFSPKKLGIYSLFLLLSWGLLYTWLVLVHRIDEKVASTLLSSPLIYGCIALSVVFLVIQNKAGAFIELLIIAFWLMVIFVCRHLPHSVWFCHCVYQLQPLSHAAGKTGGLGWG